MTDTRISLDAAKKSVERVGPKPEVEPEFTPITAAEKLDHKHRLEAEGRYEPFEARREEIRRALRQLGVAKPRAVEKSWRQALGEYPPLPVEEEEEPPEVRLSEEALARYEADTSPIDLKADMEQAYRKHIRPGLTIMDFEDRPTAYGFYRQSQLSSQKFLDNALKYLGVSNDEDEEAEVSERDVKLDDQIEKMEREFPVEGAQVACPECSAMLQLPNSLRTGDDAKSPEFQLRVAR